MLTNTKILIVIMLLFIAAFLALTVYTIGTVVAMLLLSLLFAFIISPAVDFLEGKGVPRSAAAVVVFLFSLAAFAFVVYILSPLILKQLLSLQEMLNLGQLRRGITQFERLLQRNLSFLGVRRITFGTKVEEWLGAVFDNVLNIASGLVGLIIFIVMTLISTFFLLKDGRRLKKSFIEIVPNQFFEMALSIMHKIDWSLGAYLRGIVLDALVIGVLATIAMWLLGIPNYALIGVVAAVANLVPYLGPPTAALVAGIISVLSLNTFEQVPIILVAFTVIRLIDDAIVQPLTISQSVKLHPLTIIFTILIGGHLFGILGMLFAVPVAGVIKVVLSELYAGLKRYRAVY
jgi:putative permease